MKLAFPLMIGGVCAAILLLFFCSVTMHELTHQAIFRYYGVDSVPVNYGFSGETVPLNDFPTPEAYYAAFVGHSFNEVIGYNVVPLLIVLVGLVMFQSVLLVNVAVALRGLKHGQ